MSLTSKITRKSLATFLAKHTSQELAINIGSGNTDHSQHFPNINNCDVVNTDQVQFIADAHSLPIKDKAASLVLCTEVLEHTQDPQRVIDELFRILKPKGKLILSTRFIFPLHETPHDYYRFTKYGLKHLLRNWTQVEIEPESNTQTSLASLLQRLAYQSEIIFKLPVINLIFHLIAKIISALPNMFIREFGDIRREQSESEIITTGYYLTAVKK